jgi:acyl-CoA thioesterase-2
MTDTLNNLITILHLNKATDGHWHADSEITSWGRIFGGQVVAQAMAAAHQTVSGRSLHAIHGTFMRPGNCLKPIAVSVEESFSGGSFSTRHVAVHQQGKPIFQMSASFQAPTAGYAHQTDMPDVPMPEELLSEDEMMAKFGKTTPMPVRQYWRNKGAFERRVVSLDRYQTNGPLPPHHAMWVRARGPVDADQWLHDALLGYVSDMTLLETSLFPHGKSVASPDIRAASLDHSLWIHHPPKIDDWLLFDQYSPFADNARGLTLGSFYDRNGLRIATVAQEGMIRSRATK